MNRNPIYEVRSIFATAGGDADAVQLVKEIDRLLAAHMPGSQGPNTTLIKTSTTNIPWTTWRPGDVPLSTTDAAANDAVMASIGEEHTVVELLAAADELSYSTVMTLGAVVLKLERRRQDIEELLSIAKSGQELSRKVKRLAERLGVQEGPDGR